MNHDAPGIDLSRHTTLDRMIIDIESVTLLSQEDVDALGTYDHSLPTGTRIGKRWKKSDGKGGWKMGEYVNDPDPKMVGIRWTTIRVPKSGPIINADKPCSCGLPATAGIMHRQDGPCYHMDHPTMDDVVEAVDKAELVVHELSAGKRQWSMSIPARPCHDPDIIISGALDMAKKKIADLRADNKKLTDARDYERDLANDARQKLTTIENQNSTLASLEISYDRLQTRTKLELDGMREAIKRAEEQRDSIKRLLQAAISEIKSHYHVIEKDSHIGNMLDSFERATKW